MAITTANGLGFRGFVVVVGAAGAGAGAAEAARRSSTAVNP